MSAIEFVIRIIYRLCRRDILLPYLTIETPAAVSIVWIEKLALWIEGLAHVVGSPAGGTFVGLVV